MDDILLVEVQKVFPIESMEDGTPQDVRFRLVEVLKGQTNKHLSRFPLEIPEENTKADTRNSGLPQSMFSPGNQLVLFLRKSEVDFIPYPHCEVVLASPDNLAVIRQTLAQLAQRMPISALTEEGRLLP